MDKLTHGTDRQAYRNKKLALITKNKQPTTQKLLSNRLY